jgi:hypothetical protein
MSKCLIETGRLDMQWKVGNVATISMVAAPGLDLVQPQELIKCVASQG